MNKTITSLQTARSVRAYQKKFLFGLAVAVGTLSIGCANKSDGFSLLSEQNVFRQSTAYTSRKVDILWVVDNSGSMASSQTKLANNFQSFIQQFSRLGYDFKMAVGTTDAYLRLHYNDNNRATFKTGSGGVNSGVTIMDKNTPNLADVFSKNVKVGINGFGDERALESMKQLLVNPLNASFRRQGAFLAVIIVSDEEDYSHYDWFNGTNSYFMSEDAADSRLFSNSTNPIHATNNPAHGFHSPSFYKAYLDQLTGGNETIKNYTVNSIVIKDQACKNELQDNAQKLAPRVIAFSELVGGAAYSLCQPFDNVLNSLQQEILQGANTFVLNRVPIIATIVVRVNGQAIAQDPVNGWVYDAASNSVTFKGNSIPPADAVISIDFDPESVVI